MRSATLLLVAVAALVGAAAASKSAADCAQLGFVSDALRCSHCDVLLRHTSDPSLYAECKDCCSESKDLGRTAGSQQQQQSVYARAVLDVDLRFVREGSELQQFLDKHLESFGDAVTVSDVMRSPGRLSMIDKSGAVGQSLRIQNWRADQIADYLKKMLSSA